MNQICKIRHYKIYQTDDGYILHNSKMPGFAHSHIKNYKTAVYIAELSIKQKMPHHLCSYLIISLIRVNDDETYLRHLNELLNSKQNRGKKEYYNVNKGVPKK